MSSTVGGRRRRTEFAGRGRRSVVRCGRCRPGLRLGGLICQSERKRKQRSGYTTHCGCRLGSMTPKRAGRRSGAAVKRLKESKEPVFSTRIFLSGSPFARETHPACPAYPGGQLWLGAGRNI
jgi:hypothetical protein